jgi:hypothetical protein
LKDKALLELIRAYFGVGSVTKKGKDQYQYRVCSVKDIVRVIIPHFIKYPLISQKRADFEIFKSIVEMLDRKEHLTPAGLQEIVNRKAFLNKGLPEPLKAAFPKTKYVTRPKVEYSGIPDPN